MHSFIRAILCVCQQITDAVVRSYEYLQHFAVAMEQLVLDQMVVSGNFYHQFRGIEEKLLMALCQLQLALAKLRIEPNPNVTRDVMAEEYRTVDSETVRNVRNYIILRDHSMALKYIASVFQKIVQRIEEQER